MVYIVAHIDIYVKAQSGKYECTKYERNIRSKCRNSKVGINSICPRSYSKERKAFWDQIEVYVDGRFPHVFQWGMHGPAWLTLSL